MTRTLLNRDFQTPADGYFHIVSLGEHPISVDSAQFAGFQNASASASAAPAAPAAARRRVAQVTDPAACAAMLNAFQVAAAKPDFPGLLVDFDHDSDEHSTVAAGWITNMQQRSDGLWAQIRWSDIGLAAVQGGRYRFVSPVWSPSNCRYLGNDRIRPLVLDELALTNKPNFRNLRPLTNAQTRCGHMNPDGTFIDGFDGCVLHMQECQGHSEDSAKRICAEIGRSAGKIPNRKVDAMKDKLVPILKLAADASDDAIVAAVQGLANRAAEADGLKTRAEAAEKIANDLRKADLDRQIEADLETHKDKIGNRDEVKAALQKDREGTLKLLNSLKLVAPADGGKKLLNRADGKPPAGDPADPQKVRNDQRAAVRTVQNRLKADGKRADFDTAWKLAAAENPDLFKSEAKQQ